MKAYIRISYQIEAFSIRKQKSKNHENVCLDKKTFHSHRQKCPEQFYELKVFIASSHWEREKAQQV